MAAFNFVKVELRCPSCGHVFSGELQTYVAASFNGDEEGRFCHGVYGLGERMRWWKSDSPKYQDWRAVETGRVVSADEVEEETSAPCPNCARKLKVLLRFVGLIPMSWRVLS